MYLNRKQSVCLCKRFKVRNSKQIYQIQNLTGIAPVTGPRQNYGIKSPLVIAELHPLVIAVGVRVDLNQTAQTVSRHLQPGRIIIVIL